MMLNTLLGHLAAVHIGAMIGVALDEFGTLLIQNSHRFLNKRVKICRSIGGEDRISALPDDLLVKILLHIPTKDSVATMVLSKRWRFVWTMVPKLVYSEKKDDTREIVVAGLLGRLLDRVFGKSDRRKQSIWRFVDESLRLHKADLLKGISIQLGKNCPIDIDVGKLITNVVDRKVRELAFLFSWSSKPTKLPNCLYTCRTIVSLCLYDKILVDVPSHMTCFPSLKYLGLYYVMYKDEETLVRLLSSCSVLKYLVVRRYREDNVTNFIIKVPSLECFVYDYHQGNESLNGTLVIDSPGLKKIFITDYSGNSCSIENKPRFDKAKICVHRYLDNKFMRSLASLMYLELSINFATVEFCNVINFSKLLECKITLVAHELDMLEPVMRLLQNSPNLKTLFIDQSMINGQEEELSLSWNEPSSVPRCLSNHLEIFEWKGYEGRSKEEEMVRYIFANSKCLKRAGISIKPKMYLHIWKRKKKMMKELESMHRISTSSQLIFSTQLNYVNVRNEMNDLS